MDLHSHIVDGQKAITTGTTVRNSPRTAIGQKKDGAIILLVNDGRQANSIGATLKEYKMCYTNMELIM